MRAALARRSNLHLRVFATVMIALMLHVYMGASWTWLWAGTYAAAQLLELVLIRRLVREPHSGRALRFAVAAMPAITSIIFGFLSVPLFASGVRFAPTLGGMLLAGALLNVIVVNSSLRSATISAAAPHVVYLLIVPLVARAMNGTIIR